MIDKLGNGVSLEKYIMDIMLERFTRRDEAHQALQDTLEASVRAIEKASELAAKTYPTTEDFNRLKDKVSTEISENAGRTKNLTLLASLVSTLALVVSVLFAYLSYIK